MTSPSKPEPPAVSSPRNVPFSLAGWLEANREAFSGPVSNKVVWSGGDQIYMIIKGPNARSDFHIDPRDEIFQQLTGDIQVDLMIDGKVESRIVREGDIMLVPAGTPHAPHRPADTWGLVIESPRDADEIDQLVWYCDECSCEVHRVEFHVSDIETQLRVALEAWNNDPELRRCPDGHVSAVPQPFRFGASNTE